MAFRSPSPTYSLGSWCLRISLNNLLALYSRYGDDLVRIWKQQARFNDRYNIKHYQRNRFFNYLLYRNRNFKVKGTSNTGAKVDVYPPSYDDLEAEITYLLIREFKPKNVVEISPASGWSPSWILSALRDNETGFLTSFDIIDDSKKMLPDILTKNRWKFVMGDVKQTVKAIPSNIDHLFIDSDHSAPFAEWYINNVFPLVNANSPVSIHDIYLRKKVWGEIDVVLKWLKDKGINWISPSKYTPSSMNKRSKLLEARKKAGVNKFVSHNRVDPSIFFLMPA